MSIQAFLHFIKKVLLLFRDVTVATRHDGQTTIPFHAVMVRHALEMTTAPAGHALVHHLRAFIVNSATMTHVV